MKYVDYSGLYRILANLKAWIKSVFVSNVTVSGRTISVTKNDQTTSTDLSYPTATDAVSGVVKLYGTLGASTDGTLTRAAITALERFGYRFNGETTPSTFSNDIDTASTGDFIPQVFLAKTAGDYAYSANVSVTLAAGEIALICVDGPSISLTKHTLLNVVQTTGNSQTAVMSQAAVTGALDEILTTMGHGYEFHSVITPSSMPSLTGLDDDDKLVFLGLTPGTYTFRQSDAFTLADGEVGLFFYSGDAFTMQKIGLATTSTTTSLANSITGILGRINNGALYAGPAPAAASYPSGVSGQEYIYLAGPGTYTGYDQQDIVVPANRCALLYLRGVNDGGMELLPIISTAAIVTETAYSGSAVYTDDQVLSAKAVQGKFFQKANIITNAGAGISGSNDQVASDKELNARLAQIRAEMAQIGGFSTAYTTLAALEAAAEAGQLDARKIYLIPLDEEGPTDVYSEYILITAQGQLYKCDECGYVYNPDKGDPDHSVPPGTPFTDLPSDWVCPECENTQDNFTAIAGYVERIGSTSLDMDAITNAEIDQAFVDNGMVPAS